MDVSKGKFNNHSCYFILCLDWQRQVPAGQHQEGDGEAEEIRANEVEHVAEVEPQDGSQEAQ